MKPQKQVLFDSEERKSLPEVVSFLRTVADRFEGQGFLTLAQGERQVEVRPQGAIVLEVKYEVQGDKQKLEIEIEWRPGTDPLSIA